MFTSVVIKSLSNLNIATFTDSEFVQDTHVFCMQHLINLVGCMLQLTDISHILNLKVL